MDDVHPRPLLRQILRSHDAVARGGVSLGTQQCRVVESGLGGHLPVVELRAELVRELVERQTFLPVRVHELLARREFQNMLVIDVGDGFKEPREIVFLGEAGELIRVVPPDVHHPLHAVIAQQVKELLGALL